MRAPYAVTHSYMYFIKSSRWQSLACFENTNYICKYATLYATFITQDRSFPSHKMFMEGTNEGKEGRAALFRVLAVYAMYNPQVSYCQGTHHNTLYSIKVTM